MRPELGSLYVCECCTDMPSSNPTHEQLNVLLSVDRFISRASCYVIDVAGLSGPLGMVPWAVLERRKRLLTGVYGESKLCI